MFDIDALTAATPGVRIRPERLGERAITWTPVVDGPTEEAGLAPRLGSLRLPGVTALVGMSSAWGLEFGELGWNPAEPFVHTIASGRSGNGAYPWLLARSGTGSVVVTVHWSGNWWFGGLPVATAGDACDVLLTIGLAEAGQRIHVTDDEGEVELPKITVAWGADDLAACEALARHQLQAAPSGPPLLTEWNHWWPYEDEEIDEGVFLANAAKAAELGLEVAVLDAGWFGSSELDSTAWVSSVSSNWFADRGDWDVINTARFPHGLAWLADRTRELGLAFGLWVEAEAVGARAQVGRRRELLATDAAGDPLGYVCLASPAGRDHVVAAVDGLIRQTGARWIKWDFNLDPGDGCARDDHGHRADEGLLGHYRGLYAVLDRLRTAHPDTIFEGCSSGGLRIDLGLAEHVDAMFLSDPDWTEHHLSCVWGAARMLPPRQVLHWPQSEWRGEHRFQKVDYSGSLITVRDFDTKIRAALLHRFGVSIRLTDLRPDLAERLAGYITLFRDVVRPMIADGVLVGLSGQPLREGLGERQPAFQLTAADGSVLVAGFRLPPSPQWQPIRPIGLDPRGDHAVRPVDGTVLGEAVPHTGADLLGNGLLPADTHDTSALWLITPG